MKRLLVIDDDIGLAKVYAMIGERLGFGVKVINDPSLATETFLKWQPDLTVLDLMMPGKDGLDILNEMLLANISARIIVTTGFGEGMLRLARELAAFHASDRVSVMKKPIRRHALAEAFSQALGC